MEDPTSQLPINFPEIITVRMGEKLICEHRHERKAILIYKLKFL